MTPGFLFLQKYIIILIVKTKSLFSSLFLVIFLTLKHFLENFLHLSEEKHIFAKKTMPTIFIFFGFRFMFYSNDHEPIHVHVIKDGYEAKYNVSPLIQIYNHGFKKHDIALIESIISENEAVIIDRWKEYFNQK